LISTTELLGDFLGGGVAGGQIFSRTLFNANNAGAHRTAFFHRRVTSLNLARLVVIATESTASASESAAPAGASAAGGASDSSARITSTPITSWL